MDDKVKQLTTLLEGLGSTGTRDQELLCAILVQLVDINKILTDRLIGKA